MNLNENPAISIIIPVYNAEKYLKECLDSIVSQTMRSIEIICINDGSVDDSLNILKKYAKQDSRIHIYNQENSGVSVARNVGIQAARGECIIFIDADDYVDIKMMEILWENYKKYQADIIVFGGVSFPHTEWVDKKLATKDSIYEFNSINALFYETGSIPFLWNKLFKLKLLKQKKLAFDANYALGEDQIFQFLLFPAARKIQYISNKFYHYRVGNANSAMSHFGNKFKLKNNIHLQIVQKIIDEWKIQGYLSGNEHHLMRWAVKFLKNCTVDTPKHAVHYCVEAIKLFDQITYQPSIKDDFFKTYQKIHEIAKTKQKPAISVIVPVYNVEDVLAACIDSLLAQTFKDFEVIFVDDGSEDNSLNILRKYEDIDPRITVLQQENKFAGVARNYAITKAIGDYLIFLDSDDLFEPNLLEEMHKSITKYDCDICVCAVKSYDHVTHEYKPMPWKCKTKFIPENIVFSKNDKDKNPYIYCFTTPAPWNKIFKRSFIQDNNLLFQNTRSANDMFFVLMALSLAERIVINAKELINYRINNSKSLQATQDKDFYAFYEATYKLKLGLISKEVYDIVKDPFINFSLDSCLYNLSTMKTEKTFLELYEFIKNKAFKELDINSKDKDFFYGYSPNNGERKELLNQLSAREYINKFNLNFKDKI